MGFGRTALLSAMLLASTASLAQGMIVGGPPSQSLRSGTEVPLRLVNELTTNGKLLKVGARFDLETTMPISVDGQVVIPTGSHAVGEITTIRNKGMWGKSGTIEGRILYVTANGRNIALSGSLSDKGTTGTAGVVGAVILIPIAGFFVTGTSAVIPAGAAVRGFINEDISVAFAPGSAPAPMVVAAPVAVVAAPPAAAGMILEVSAKPGAIVETPLAATPH